MTPEMKLAEALGTLPTTKTEKLAAKMQELSKEELEAILRESAPVKEKTSSSHSFDVLVEMADEWGRDLARLGLEKTALMPPAATQIAGGALRAVTRAPMAQRAAVGAAGGAALGVGRYATSNNPNQSFIGSVAGGAALGAGAGAAARPAAKALLQSGGKAGNFARGALRQANTAAAPARAQAVKGAGAAVKPPVQGA